MTSRGINPSLSANPRVGDWIEIDPEGTIRLKCGKVELGQHVHVALRQIAADALGVDAGTVTVTSVETGSSADEGLTAGSMSIEHGGQAVHAAATAAAELLRRCAAARLGINDTTSLQIVDGEIFSGGKSAGVTLAAVASDVEWLQEIASVDVAEMRRGRHVGFGLPPDHADAVARGAPYFIQDLALPGMLHVRMLRHRQRGASRESLDVAAILALEGVDDLVSEGAFLALLGEDEAALVQASEAARQHVEWRVPAVPEMAGPVSEWLPRRQSLLKNVGQAAIEVKADRTVLRGRFSRPILLHGSIGPSTALARYDGNVLEVWTHSQGPYPLRVALSRALGLEALSVVVRHAPSSGCYGHNGADDVAMDAALVALRRPGKLVRVVWTRHDDMIVAPSGAPMVTEIAASLGPDGLIASWTSEVWSATHAQRPGGHGNINLLAAEEIDPENRPDVIQDVPPAVGGGAERNLVPLYIVPAQAHTVHIIQDLPHRSSALRSLGAHLNVTAIEATMDDLADLAGADPVAFRLAHLEDERARAVLTLVAEMAAIPGGGEERAWGIGFARYKNRGAYAAIVAEIELEDEVRLRRVWAGVDAGLLINPDAVLNQIEGGIIQSASWTLTEQAVLSAGAIGAEGWADYPVLGFSDIPEVEVRFLNEGSRLPPLGVGECVQGPTAAAIGNAVARALGVRVHDLPFSRERVLAALS